MDDEVLVEGRILEWGNSYGIRLKKADLERAGLAPGEDAVVRVARRQGKVDLKGVHTFRDDPDTAEHHDEHLARGRAADMARKSRARR